MVLFIDDVVLPQYTIPNPEHNKPLNRRKLNHANYLRKTREQIHNWNTFVSFIFLLCFFIQQMFCRYLTRLMRASAYVRSRLFSAMLLYFFFECAWVWKWLRKPNVKLVHWIARWECQTVLQAHHKPRFTVKSNLKKYSKKSNNKNNNINREQRKVLSFISFFGMIFFEQLSTATHNQRLSFFSSLLSFAFGKNVVYVDQHFLFC